MTCGCGGYGFWCNVVVRVRTSFVLVKEQSVYMGTVDFKGSPQQAAMEARLKCDWRHHFGSMTIRREIVEAVRHLAPQPVFRFPERSFLNDGTTRTSYPF